MINYMLNGKDMIVHLIVGKIKKTQYKRVNIFPKPNALGTNVKVDLDLSNYVANTDLGVDTSSFAIKVGLANLKSDVDKLDFDKLKNIPTYINNFNNEVDKLDVDKLIPVPVDLSKLSDVGKVMLLKKMYLMLR